VQYLRGGMRSPFELPSISRDARLHFVTCEFFSRETRILTKTWRGITRRAADRRRHAVKAQFPTKPQPLCTLLAARSLARRDSHEIPASSSASHRLSHSRDGRGVRLSIHRSRSRSPPCTRSFEPVARFLTHHRVRIDRSVYT